MLSVRPHKWECTQAACHECLLHSEGAFQTLGNFDGSLARVWPLS